MHQVGASASGSTPCLAWVEGLLRRRGWPLIRRRLRGACWALLIPSRVAPGLLVGPSLVGCQTSRRLQCFPVSRLHAAGQLGVLIVYLLVHNFFLRSLKAVIYPHKVFGRMNIKSNQVTFMAHAFTNTFGIAVDP